MEAFSGTVNVKSVVCMQADFVPIKAIYMILESVLICVVVGGC